MTDILAEVRYPGWMDDDEELPEALVLEVRTDPWALARRYEAPERAALVALGFEHLGYVFKRVPGIEWERAEVGYTSEVLVDPDRRVVASLDLFFDVGLVTLETLFDDGRIACTRYVPEEVFDEDVLFARLTFASTPRAGRVCVALDTFDAGVLVAAHHELVNGLTGEAGRPVSHDIAAYFALQHRGEDIDEAKADDFGRLVRGWMGLAAGLVLADVAWVTGWIGAPGGAVLALHLALALAVFTVPWVKLLAALTRLPLVPARELLALEDVTDRVGDHVVHAAR